MEKQQTYIEQIISRGYKSIPEIITPSEELLSIKELIDSTNHSRIIPATLKKKYVLQKSRDFLDSHFKIREVPYYNEQKIGPFRIERYGTIHPYGLPIVQIQCHDTFHGCLREVLKRKENIITGHYYSGVELNKKLSELSSLAYTHELAHSQTLHLNGVIESYSNTEFLSIFLETLQAYETSDKLLRIHDSERLSEVAGVINELEKYHDTTDEEIKNILVEGSSYLESTLKAYKLFIRYINSSVSVQKEILNGIQKIFNEELSLEDFLLSQDINFENSQNIEVFNRYLKR